MSLLFLNWLKQKGIRYKPVAQSCAVAVEVKNSGGPLDNQTWHTRSWPQQKLPKFNFRTHTTALWPVEQSSILSAKFDCPVARQNISLLTAAHDCETGPFSCLFSENNWSGGVSHSVSVECLASRLTFWTHASTMATNTLLRWESATWSQPWKNWASSVVWKYFGNIVGWKIQFPYSCPMP